MHNRRVPLAAVALLLVSWQASPVGAQVAGMARVGAFAIAPLAGAGGPISAPASSPLMVLPGAHRDSSGERSNVKRRVVLGAVIGIAATVALASFAVQRYAAHSAQSDCQECVITTIVAVPVVGLGGLLGGYLGWRSADHPHPTTQN
ncbi:MAG: hypothetical protein JWM95_1552 [Gemmatimonadetes bacterium]|nr:hypothetical protein [Gemmatimonadota bacterium]